MCSVTGQSPSLDVLVGVGCFQLPAGQQPIQLLSLQQQQRGGQLKTGTLTAAITSAPQQGGISRQGAGNSTAVPLSTGGCRVNEKCDGGKSKDR